jgi:ADP-ribose pyrophosphatase YjhB (NUDIX family)
MLKNIGIKENTGESPLWFKGENRAADSLVTARCRGRDYVLMIQRPGGTLAFPGGFVAYNRKGMAAAEKTARRETEEETAFDLDGQKATYVGKYRKKDRDPRADTHRWVSTRVFHFDLGEVTALPAVTHREDPDKTTQAATWLTFSQALSRKLFADHRKIMLDFIERHANVCEVLSSS